MSVVKVAEQGVHSEPGWRRTGLATPSKGAKELRVDRMKFEGGQSRSGMMHQHDHEEITVVLSGSVVHRVGDQEYRLSAGDVVIVPPGTLHGPGLESGQEYEALVIHPAGTKFLGQDGKEMSLPSWWLNL